MRDTIALGDKVRDIVTGAEGITTGRYEFLNGCVRFMVERQKDGGVEELYFDEQRLEVVQKNVVAATPIATVRVDERPTGGPRPTPPRSGQS